MSALDFYFLPILDQKKHPQSLVMISDPFLWINFKNLIKKLAELTWLAPLAPQAYLHNIVCTVFIVIPNWTNWHPRPALWLVSIHSSYHAYVISAVIWRYSHNIASYIRTKMYEWDFYFFHSKLEETYAAFV
jgi:hypothetical protein